jgi:hypothetical protein
MQNVIDVDHNPQLKSLLLQGRLNVGVCPQCGTGGMLSAPLVYHDSSKDLLLCLIPQELGLTENDRQRTIGQLSNAIINHLPAEQRRGYLLQPKQFLTFQSFVEAILEADGITREMMAEQEARVQLISELVQVSDDSLRLAALINEHSDKIDVDFFALLAAHIQMAEEQQSDSAAVLNQLRQTLIEKTEVGREIGEREKALEEMLEGIDENTTREELLSRVEAIAPVHAEQVLSMLIAVARPLIDYQFFQLLTQQIESLEVEGQAEQAEALKAKRSMILDIAQRLDAEIRARTREKANLLTEIVSSESPRDTIRARLQEFDSVFLSVLEANIAQAQAQHQHEVEGRLLSIRNLIVEVMQESAPPQIRFINQLLQAEYPDGTRSMLRENQAALDDDMLSLFDILANDLAESGDTETSERLTQIKAQAQLLTVSG